MKNESRLTEEEHLDQENIREVDKIQSRTKRLKEKRERNRREFQWKMEILQLINSVWTIVEKVIGWFL